MNIRNGPVLCPYCGYLGAYYEIDRISALRQKLPESGHQLEWDNFLRKNKKKAFCLICRKKIDPSRCSGKQ
jgi:hypothetical protein